MQRYDAVESGIARQDVEALREAVGSICYTNRDFSSGEFDEVVRYVESKGIRLKEERLVGSVISEGKDTFSEEDFARAVFELKKNFCDERIKDVKTIGRSLYAGKNIKREEKILQRPSAGSPSPEGIRPNASGHQSKSNMPIMAGLVAVVVIVIIVIIILLLIKK